MDQVAAQIKEGGMDTFVKFIRDPSYGPTFFLGEIAKASSRNSDNILIPSMIRWGFRAQQWGHANFPNPNYGELRHQISSYLAAEKFGVNGAQMLGNGNELIGLYLDIRNPGPGSAFEWGDVFNNYEGINLWIDHNMHYYQD